MALLALYGIIFDGALTPSSHASCRLQDEMAVRLERERAKQEVQEAIALKIVWYVTRSTVIEPSSPTSQSACDSIGSLY
jgi:hypothetical protein